MQIPLQPDKYLNVVTVNGPRVDLPAQLRRAQRNHATGVVDTLLTAHENSLLGGETSVLQRCHVVFVCSLHTGRLPAEWAVGSLWTKAYHCALSAQNLPPAVVLQMLQLLPYCGECGERGPAVFFSP